MISENAQILYAFNPSIYESRGKSVSSRAVCSTGLHTEFPDPGRTWGLSSRAPELPLNI